MEVEHPPHESMSEILHKDFYTPAELAELLDLDVNQIRDAVFMGDLKGVIVDHEIIGIPREAVIQWLERGPA